MALSNSGKYRLLAVDDDKDNAELIVRTALRCGYESFPVHDSKALRDVIPHWRPHVVTLDLALPDIRGFEAISALKSVEFKGELLIISGKSDSVRENAAKFAAMRGLRVAAHMPKPVQLAELRDLLTTIKAGLFLSLLNQFGTKQEDPHKAKA
jgi:two-component system response regulator CpxR